MFCTGCGHRLGAGRFCTNCGRPIGDQPDAAPPTAPTAAPTNPPPSAPPPPAFTAPPPPRYPLYSDEPYATAAGSPTAPAQRPPQAAPPRPTTGRPGPSWLPVALTLIVLLLMAAIGAMLLVSGGGDDDEKAGDATPANGNAGSKSSPSKSPPATGPTATPPPADGPQDLARFATATASVTAPPNSDTQGNQVRYDAANMVDGVAETCWRMPGDGTGQELTFTLTGPTELTEVGLINGYAKSSGRFDWYAGNRRVLAAEWVFDDGTMVAQSLTQTRDMQTIPIDPVTTSTVKLRLVSVSPPGRGPSARNYTAISDVSLVGEPA